MKKGEEKDSLAMVGEESRKLLGAPDVAWSLRRHMYMVPLFC